VADYAEPFAATIFRRTQCAVLVDFGALTETQVEPIYQAWLRLSDDTRKEMEQDFQDIDELATEGGSKAILDEARWHGEDLAHGFP
jgi:hypothetical protein